jgi:exonuclease III
MDIKVVSWNLCGLSKLERWPSVIEWLHEHDVIMIQESLQTTQTFNFDDVTRFDFPAAFTAGRARGGLIVALSNKKFGTTRTEVLMHDEHMLAVEIISPTTKIIIVNLYMPVHSTGFQYEQFQSLEIQLELLTSNYNFSVIIAGNLNIHGITRV